MSTLKGFSRVRVGDLRGGARDWNRTRKPAKALNFESSVFTNFTTRAC